MKKILLFGLSAFLMSSSFAQQKSVNFMKQSKNGSAVTNSQEEGKFIVDGVNSSKVISLGNKKYRATPFATDDLGSGTATALPTGWTTGGSAPACVWVWKNAAFGGTYNIGTIASTSAANGWLGFDSDGIGTAVVSAPFSGWVQKSFNCTGHSSVALTFQTKFRKFSDSCMVRVSNNGGTTWTNFWISETNSITNNDATSNPATVFFNISSVAASQPNVLVRFSYDCNIAGGAYNWLVDDIALSELDPIDVKISKSSFSAFTTTSSYTYASIPVSLQDSITPFSFYSNYGATAVNNALINGTYYKGTTNVGTTTITQPTLPINAADSGRFASTSFLPTGIADYKLALSLSVAGDANTSNNIDTVKFSVTDSTYSLNAGLTSGGYICHTKATASGPERSFYIGNIFDVPFDDTLTQSTVCFTSSTQSGGKVRVLVYKFDGTAWGYYAKSNLKTLAATDISTSTALVLAKFNFPYIGGVPTLLTAGTYALVVEADGPTSTSADIFVQATKDLNSVNGFGVSDTLSSPNSFAGSGLPSGLGSTPMVNAIFGHSNPATPDAVSDIDNNIMVSASPNPASSDVTFSLTLNNNANNVNIEILNSLGQVITSNQVGSVTANVETKSTISVKGLAAGMYMYNVTADGKSLSGKLMVK